MASLTLSTFSGVRAVATRPGGSFFIIVTLVQKDATHLKVVLRLGMFPWRPIVKRQRKSRWVSIIDSLIFKKLSYANTRCSNVHCGMTATEMALIAPLAAPNIHFKNVRFPWRNPVYIPFRMLTMEPPGNKTIWDSLPTSNLQVFYRLTGRPGHFAITSLPYHRLQRSRNVSAPQCFASPLPLFVILKKISISVILPAYFLLSPWPFSSEVVILSNVLLPPFTRGQNLQYSSFSNFPPTNQHHPPALAVSLTQFFLLYRLVYIQQPQ